ncbi:TetR/AcrR family transcriptional regulator [Mycolicibacterium lacusdiani]|uniref:TetR/AcrR family transcriptional regulator n=1 Tax=Mycolicibacterium lacusdiani TaxID=2895283 RepID=UPI001F39750F|nr:TetR/AcrR family transcriptional regulator [Mycolicibacterium lacusdiani]
MSAERRAAGGRPRAFDEDHALDGAIDVFWRLGYEGASLTELTRAMGINKPSMYAVFGSKEELFVRALERYGLLYRVRLDAVLAKSTTYEVLESYLRSVAESATRGSVAGCLSIQGGLSCAPDNARIPLLLAEYRQGLEDAVAKALSQTVDATQPGVNTAALAGYAVTVGQGIAVHAAAGVDSARLDAVVDVALAGLASHLVAKEPGDGSTSSPKRVRGRKTAPRNR